MPVSQYLTLFNPGKPPEDALDLSHPVLLEVVCQYATATDEELGAVRVEIPEEQVVFWGGMYYQGAVTDQAICPEPGAGIDPGNWWVGPVAPYSKIDNRRKHYERLLKDADQGTVDWIDWLMRQVCEGMDSDTAGGFCTPAVWLQLAEYALYHIKGNARPGQYLVSTLFLESRLQGLWGDSTKSFDLIHTMDLAHATKQRFTPVPE